MNIKDSVAILLSDTIEFRAKKALIGINEYKIGKNNFQKT